MERISFVLAATLSFAAAVGMLSYDIVIYSRGGCAGRRNFRIPWAARLFLLLSQGLTLLCVRDKFMPWIPVIEMFAAAGIAMMPSGDDTVPRTFRIARKFLSIAAFLLLPVTFFVQSGHSSFPVVPLWTLLSALLLLGTVAAGLSRYGAERCHVRARAGAAALLLAAGMMAVSAGSCITVMVPAGIIALAAILLSAFLDWRRASDEGGAGPDVPSSCAELADGVQDSLRERFEQYFEQQKPYLDPDLSINDVARGLCSNKTYISRMLNGQMGQNFNQVVNGYRIRYAMEHFRNNPTLRVFDLADASGFKSLSTFSLAFRIHAGEAPGDWCRKTRASMSRNRRQKQKSPLIVEE